MKNPLKSKGPAVLLYDIETFPIVGYVWDLYNTNVIAVKEWSYMMSFAWQWAGEKTIHTAALPDFKLYKKDRKDDRELCQALWDLFDKTDVVLAHNGNSFDNKKANARFIKHGFKPYSPFKTIDTREIAKKYFRFDSNKLNNIGTYLNIGEKLTHTGIDMWLDAGEMNDSKAWKMMREYNKQDVSLLADTYLRMRPWIETHPNFNLYAGTMDRCPRCGHDKLIRRGYYLTRVTKVPRFQCTNCGGYSHSPVTKDNELKILR